MIALVFAEALAPAILGAGLGLGLAALLAGAFPSSCPPCPCPNRICRPLVIAEALLAVVVLAFLSVILPALRLRRLDVAAILAGRT